MDSNSAKANGNENRKGNNAKPHIIRAKIAGLTVYVSELGYVEKRKDAKQYTNYDEAFKVIQQIKGASTSLFITSPLEEITAIPCDSLEDCL